MRSRCVSPEFRLDVGISSARRESWRGIKAMWSIGKVESARGVSSGTQVCRARKVVWGARRRGRPLDSGRAMGRTSGPSSSEARW